MPISWTPLEEGDTLNALSLNGKFSLIAAALNDIEMTDVLPRALDAQHLPDLSFSSTFSNGYSAITPDVDVEINGVNIAGVLAGRDRYQNWVDAPSTMQAFAPGSGGAPYGPLPAGTTSAQRIGWRIVAYNRAPSFACEVALGAATTCAAAGMTGILVQAGVGLYRPDANPGVDEGVTIAIGWEDGSGARHIVERSIRFFDLNHNGTALETMTFLQDSDLTAGDNQVLKIFLAIAGADPSSSSQDDPGLSIEIDFYNITCTPILAGAL